VKYVQLSDVNVNNRCAVGAGVGGAFMCYRYVTTVRFFPSKPAILPLKNESQKYERKSLNDVNNGDPEKDLYSFELPDPYSEYGKGSGSRCKNFPLMLH
jgi:hypothetical protein